MHSIVLLTAMTATSGLFGGRHHKATTYVAAPSCQSGRCPSAVAPTYYPAPVRTAVRAPVAAPATYSSYYYPTAPVAASCATGNCPRR